MGQRSIRIHKGTNQLRVQNTERVPSFISISDVMKNISVNMISIIKNAYLVA